MAWGGGVVVQPIANKRGAKTVVLSYPPGTTLTLFLYLDQVSQIWLVCLKQLLPESIHLPFRGWRGMIWPMNCLSSRSSSRWTARASHYLLIRWYAIKVRYAVVSAYISPGFEPISASVPFKKLPDCFCYPLHSKVSLFSPTGYKHKPVAVL